VNNVGKSHTMPVDYAETDQREIDDILTVNINSTLRVTSLVLPGMIQRCAPVSPPLMYTISNPCARPQPPRPRPHARLLLRRGPVAHARDLLRLQGLPLHLVRRAVRGGRAQGRDGPVPEHLLCRLGHVEDPAREPAGADPAGVREGVPRTGRERGRRVRDGAPGERDAVPDTRAARLCGASAFAMSWERCADGRRR
jgi:hypothetical protein